MRAVAYIRVSTDDQVQGTSLDSQKRACLEFAEKQGIKLEKEDIFREEGVSAKLIDRPQLSAMLEYCAKNKGKITLCIVWKVDRLARKSEYHHVIKAHLAKYGVKLVSVTEPIGDDPMGNLMEGVLASFAQFDNDIRTLRTTGGMKARTEQGGWPHDAPYGYKKSRTASGVSYVVPDAETAPIMLKLLQAFESGNYTVKKATVLAYELGITTKNGGMRNWQSIKNLLINPIYAGFIQSKYTEGRMVKGLHQPLISEGTHYRIKAIISGNVKNHSKYAELEWPLRGGFIRHICGKPMTGSAPRGRSGPSPRYSCAVCRSNENGSVSKRREFIHDDFMELLSRIRPDEPTQKLFKEVVLRRWNNEFKEAIGHNAKLTDEIEAYKQRKSRVIDLFIDGKLSESDKNEKLREADDGIAMLSIQRIEADRYVTEKEAIIDSALLFMSDPAAFWNLGSISVKKRVQNTVFPEGVTYDFKTGFGTVKTAESYLLIKKIAEESAKNPSLVAATRLELVTSGL